MTTAAPSPPAPPDVGPHAPGPRAARGGPREVLGLAWPAVVSMISLTIMGTVDTWFVGRLGVAQQGAVGFANTFLWSIFCFFVGTLEIVQTFVARAVGGGRPGRAGRWGSAGLHLAIAFAIVPTALAAIGGPMFRALGIAPEMVPFAEEYFALRMLGTLPFFLSRVGDGYWRGVGDTKTPMVVSAVANVVNVALDAVWILGVPQLGIPSYGVAGAAWATTVATVVHTALYVEIARRRAGRLARGGVRVGRRADARPPTGPGVPRYRDRPSKADLRALLRVGVPSGLHWAVDVAAWTLFTVAVARLDATQAAANVIGLTVIRASFMPGFGFSTAAQTLVGQYLGAGDVASARRSGWTATRIGMAWMGAMGVLFLVFREPLVGFFSQDAEVIRVGGRLLMWAALFQLGDGVQLVLSGALRGAGDTRYVMLASLLGSWAVFAPLVVWLVIAQGHGVEAGWLAVNAWVAALVVMLVARFRGEKWTRAMGVEEVRPVPEAEVA